jgi:hypothetical protein
MPAIVTDFDPKTPELRQALDYWRGKCAGRAMPRRIDIDPVEMRAWLAGTFLADVYFDSASGRPADVHFRVAGAAVGELYGMELTNRSLSEVDMDGYRYQGFANYLCVVEQRQPKYSISRYVGDDGKPHSYEMLLMPLTRDGSACDMLLGVMMPLPGSGEHEDGIWVYDA